MNKTNLDADPCGKELGEWVEKFKPKNSTKLDDISNVANQILRREDLGDTRFAFQIYIANCEMDYLPRAITLMTRVRRFHASRCQLSTIPLEIFTFANLQFLVLSGNKITEIPSDISKLANLISFEILNNPIKKIALEIAGLTNLKSFTLDNSVIEMLVGKNDLQNLLSDKAIEMDIVGHYEVKKIGSFMAAVQTETEKTEEINQKLLGDLKNADQVQLSTKK